MTGQNERMDNDMKDLVGILSVPRADNFGSVLQRYALQNVLKGMGIDNEIIDYVSPFIVGKYKIWNPDSFSMTVWLKSNVRSLFMLQKEIMKKRRFPKSLYDI